MAPAASGPAPAWTETSPLTGAVPAALEAELDELLEARPPAPAPPPPSAKPPKRRVRGENLFDAGVPVLDAPQREATEVQSYLSSFQSGFERGRAERKTAAETDAEQEPAPRAPRRRVKGAQIFDGGLRERDSQPVRSADDVRSALSSLQRGQERGKKADKQATDHSEHWSDEEMP